jgi:hypothetical protein
MVARGAHFVLLPCDCTLVRFFPLLPHILAYAPPKGTQAWNNRFSTLGLDWGSRLRSPLTTRGDPASFLRNLPQSLFFTLVLVF